MMFALPAILNQAIIQYFTFNLPCSLWLDSSNPNNFNLDSNSNIVTWFDKSPNFFSLNRTSTTAGGTYINSNLNNYGVVRFDGVDDHVRLPSNNTTLQFRTMYKEYTCCMLFKPENVSNVQLLYGMSNPTTTVNQNAIYIESNNLIYKTQVNSNGSLCIFISTDLTFLVNTWIILIWSGYNVNTERAVFLRVNGSDNIYDSTANNRFRYEYSNTQVGYDSRIGGFNGQWFKGDIAEVIFIPKACTMNTIQILEGYLAVKWGLQGNLPLQHPYKTATPLSLADNLYYRTDNTLFI